MSEIKVGLQLYTLREQTAQDFPGVLEKVAGLGYQVVEFAGYGDIEAQEMRRILDGVGLEAVSSHVPIDKLEQELDRQIEYSQTIGAQYIMVPYLEAKDYLADEEQCKRTAEQLAQIGETCKQNGLQLGYHNHAFEFEKVGGQYILDYLYEHVPADLMQAELDLYWIKRAGLDPKAYMQQYKGRTPLIHLKDMTGDERQFFAEVGQGIIDFPSILEAAPDNGVRYYIVEQDQCERPPLESVKMSIEYLKSIGAA